MVDVPTQMAIRKANLHLTASGALALKYSFFPALIGHFSHYK